MFTNTGMPTGYDQIAPGRDLPKSNAPIAGAQPLSSTGTVTGASQYPADPSMQQWRTSAGQKRPAGQAPANFTSGMNTGDLNNLLGQYFGAAGVQNGDTGYWDNAYANWGSNDPNYFRTRLLNGIAQDNHGNMSAFGAPSASAAGGWGPGTSGWSSSSTSNNPNNTALMAALMMHGQQQQQPSTQSMDPYGTLLSYLNKATQ